MAATFEDDAVLLICETVIRVMERVMDAIDDDESLREHYLDIFPLAEDVVQAELQQYAFHLAYELFTDNNIVRTRRLAFEREAAGEDEKGADESVP
ncbi:MAG TPA: hypothetical protein VJ276_03145 [Thermoanaerobaculia bacterium]|nr:hypothetical protein [Thermoanaerobaculia bacterium]